MIKSAIALAAAAPFMAAPALAGPYVNVEANSGFTGSDYTGTTTDAHVGHAGEVGAVGYYAQVGPSFVTVDGGESLTPFCLVRLAHLLLLLRNSPSTVNSHSLVALMMPTTVMQPRLVQPGVSDI